MFTQGQRLLVGQHDRPPPLVGVQVEHRPSLVEQEALDGAPAGAAGGFQGHHERLPRSCVQP